ncbi:hypothetical protein [Streptomyces mirabilis]|uniref:hypothetical protein n=1 Tax=Streptomyces mirabilis TaxID=68239 RepID=UPI0033B20D69
MTRGTGWQPAAARQSALLLRARREWIAAYGKEPEHQSPWSASALPIPDGVEGAVTACRTAR